MLTRWTGTVVAAGMPSASAEQRPRIQSDTLIPARPAAARIALASSGGNRNDIDTDQRVRDLDLDILELGLVSERLVRVRVLVVGEFGVGHGLKIVLCTHRSSPALIGRAARLAAS